MIKNPNKIKKAKQERIVFGVVFVLFVVYALLLLYPFFFAFVASLKNGSRDFLNNMVSFPVHPKVSNYVSAIQELVVGESSFLKMTFNSIWFAVGTTCLGIFSSEMVAYVVCKYNFKLKNFFYGLSLFVMIIPIYGSLPAQYRLFSQLGFRDSPLILLSYTGGFGFNFIIIYSFFKGLSWSYAEAAFIDGAGHFKVFFSIMFPMALPAVTAITIIGFVGNWNDYLTPILYMNESYPTLASGIYIYEEKMKYVSNQPIYFAGVLLSMIPVVAIFVGFQNTIMQNVYAGGLKG